MRAQSFGEADEFRLVEGADEVRGLEDQALDGRGVARIGAEIAAPQLVRRKQREIARQIEDEVAGRGRAVARRPEHEALARRGSGLREVVDAQRERAEMPRCAGDRALQHRKRRRPRRRDLAGPRQEHGDVEVIRELARRLDRGGVPPIDQGDAAAFHGDELHGVGGLGGGREKRRHLRAGIESIRRPAGVLADVREGEPLLGAGLGRDLAEQRRLLRAPDGDRRIGAQRRLEAVELAPAELICAPELAAAAARDRRRVERHRLLAGAGENNALVVHVSVPDGGFLPPLAFVIPLLYWNRSKERARDLGSHRRSQRNAACPSPP